jgi:hypothetical protein
MVTDPDLLLFSTSVEDKKSKRVTKIVGIKVFPTIFA